MNSSGARPLSERMQSRRVAHYGTPLTVSRASPSAQPDRLVSQVNEVMQIVVRLRNGDVPHATIALFVLEAVALPRPCARRGCLTPRMSLPLAPSCALQDDGGRWLKARTTDPPSALTSIGRLFGLNGVS